MISIQIIFAWLLQTAIAAISCTVFAVLFQVPKKQLIFTGITGASAWLSFLIFRHLGMGVGISSFCAALALTWVARILSFARKEPLSTFLICGIFPIVPGTGIYNTGYQFFMGNNSAASSTGFETLKIAVLIALGIGLVSSLPAFCFTFKPQMSSARKAKGDKPL